MTIYSDLVKHYNTINNLKDKIQNIVDTDKDGITDNIEIRTSDGQLKTNPDKEDIEKVIKKLEHLEKDINNRLIEIRAHKDKDINHQYNHSKPELSK